jgi:hypothetical protein
MSDAAGDALAHCHVSSLLSLYDQAPDRGDLATLESEVMVEDATWDPTQGAGARRVPDRLEGRDPILAWFRRMLSGGVTMGEHGVRHFINTQVIRVERARALPRRGRSRAPARCLLPGPRRASRRRRPGA